MHAAEFNEKNFQRELFWQDISLKVLKKRKATQAKFD